LITAPSGTVNHCPEINTLYAFSDMSHSTSSGRNPSAVAQQPRPLSSVRPSTQRLISGETCAYWPLSRACFPKEASTRVMTTSVLASSAAFARCQLIPRHEGRQCPSELCTAEIMPSSCASTCAGYPRFHAECLARRQHFAQSMGEHGQNSTILHHVCA